MMMAKNAPAGTVTTQETTMFLTILRLMAAMPRASPTPIMAPTRVWVVDMGSPVPEASTTVPAVASCAAKPTSILPT